MRPVTLMLMACAQCSASLRCSGPTGPRMAALFTSASMREWRSSVCSTMRRTSAGLDTSTASADASAPAARASAAASSTCASVRDTSTSRAPSAA